MPEGYDQLTKRFFHIERNLGLGLDMNTSSRDIPEGASPNVRAVLFRGGNVIPAKLAIGGARVTTPDQPILHCVPFNTRTVRYLILLGSTKAWALSASGCIDITPAGSFHASTRWEGYSMMQGIEPVVVVNNNGVDAPYYWDGRTTHFESCVGVV